MLASLAAGLLTVAAAFVLLEVNFGSIFLDPSWWPRIQNDLLTLWQHATMLCSGVCATTPGVRPPTIVVIVAVGLFIAMWHGSLALREGWLPHMSAPTKSSTKAQQAAATADDADPVATTLDDLAAGRITRDEALERLRTPPRRGKSAR
jgi:hypothetical protein